jgi:DNA-binding NtrC family response regulator
MADGKTARTGHEARVWNKVIIVSQEHDTRRKCDPDLGIDRAAHVEYADSVDAARSMIRTQHPDLVVVDVRMIGGSPQGLELEGWLSEEAATHGLNVVWCRPD